MGMLWRLVSDLDTALSLFGWLKKGITWALGVPIASILSVVELVTELSVAQATLVFFAAVPLTAILLATILWAAGKLVGGGRRVYKYLYLHRNATEKGSPKAIRSPVWKQNLVKQLRPYATEYSVAHLLAFPAQAMPLLETLNSIFKQAGWQTNFTNLPLESFMHKYLGGTEVSGFSKHLVDDIARFLDEAGFYDVRKEIKKNKIKPDNRKYPYTLHRINITLGYQSED